MHVFKRDSRFIHIEPFPKKLWLASPTMHGEELQYMTEAYETNWMSTVGENIDRIEELIREYIGVPHAVALTCGTAALHLAVKLAAERLYQSAAGISTPSGKGLGGSLYGKRVFCSDLTFDATVDVRKAGMSDDSTMDITATGRRQTGSFGDYGIISFNGNKIITGSSGGMLLVKDEYSAEKARKWSTQAREAAPWYEHEELGYNYRISNVIAGVVRGQFEHMDEHIEKKKNIYERYREGFKNLPVFMNPYDEKNTAPNHWLSCILIEPSALCENVRSDREKLYIQELRKSCPDEILDALAAFDAEGRPIWKPMHLQPIYRSNAFVTVDGKRQAF